MAIADWDIGVGIGSSGTGTGDRSITADTGFASADEFKGALVFACTGVTSGTRATHACLSIGATDGVHQWCMSHISVDGKTDDTGMGQANFDDRLICFLDPANIANVVASAGFGGWAADNLVIDVTDAFPADVIIGALFFAGPLCEVVAGNIDAVTGELFTGWRADGLVTCNNDHVFDGTTLSGAMVPSIGAASVLNGAVQQACVSHSSDYEPAISSEITTQISNSKVSLSQTNDLGTFDDAVAAFDDTKVTIAHSASAVQNGVLAFRGRPHPILIRAVLRDSGSGVTAWTDAGFKPIAELIIGSMIQTTNTQETTIGVNVNPGSFGIGCTDGVKQVYAGFRDRDARFTTDSDSLASNTQVINQEGWTAIGGANACAGVHSSFDRDSGSINFSSSTIRRHLWIPFGRGGATRAIGNARGIGNVRAIG